jgi:predicted DNA-binding transcriptional regulator YafY
MNRVERMTGILLLLLDRPHTAADIARRFEVSKRTVFRDVQALCEIGVPIIAREGVGGGYSLPPEHRVPALPLTAHETFLLLLALNALARLVDIPFAQERASLIAKLRSVLPAQQLADVGPLLAAVAVDVPERQERALFLEPLLEAIRQHSWVRITYRSATRTSIQHILPRHISAQQGYWYCVAYAHEHAAERTYRVDRILDLAPADEPIQGLHVPPSPPYDDPAHPEVVVSMTARGAALVESEPHIGPLIDHLPDGTGRLVFRCPPGELPWFARYFAGLGTDADVRAPDTLREQLARLGHNLAVQYGQ